MADEDEDTILDLATLDKPDDEKPDAETPVVVGKPPPVPGPATAAGPADGLKDLETQIREGREERDRITAENRRLQGERDQAVAFAQEAERRGITQQELRLDNDIAAANTQLEMLADQYEAALTDQDFKLAAEINKKSTRLGGQLAVAEQNKARSIQQREQRERQPPPEPEPTDPVERAAKGKTPPTQAFIRSHPELVSGDGSFTKEAMQAHHSAISKGFPPDTYEYFDHIVNGVKAPAAPAPAAPPRAPSAPSYAAPVAREAAPGAAAGTFRVTPPMRRLAVEQGVSEAEWVRGFLQKKAEGKIPADWFPK